MRIPLLHADFEHGAFTKVTKALRKVWPLGDQSLMQAQNTLACLLGYNSLHDAQREASATLSVADGSLSMDKMVKSVAWRLFVRYGIDLLIAKSLASKLHLSELAAAASTAEARELREIEAAWRKGVMLDEMGYYLNHRDPWPDQTPQLLQRGMPPYKWAVLPDRRVFLWSQLVAQLEMLPEDFVADLQQAGKLERGADTADSFMMDSLVPASCVPLADALASGALASIGQWQVKWVVTEKFDVLGCCIVAEKLRGMVPRMFDADGAEAFAALANLMCGDVVPATPIVGVEPPLAERLWLLDRDSVQRLQAKMAAAQRQQDFVWHQYVLHSDLLPEVIQLHRCAAGFRLAGSAEFVERGQSYLATTMFDTAEQLRMLRDEPVFETLDVPAELSSVVAVESGIPARGSRWHDAVERMFARRKAEADLAMASEEGTRKLLDAVLASCEASRLDAAAARALDDFMPLRNEGDAEDNDDLVAERREVLANMERLGDAAISALPGLSAYAVLTIGYMVLRANGEYPGSRYQWSVQPPGGTDKLALSQLLATILVHEVISGIAVDSRASACAVAAILGLTPVVWTADKIKSWYRSAGEVGFKLSEAGKVLTAVADWREAEGLVDRVRSEGEFLRMGAAIPAKRPISAGEALGDMYAKARSHGLSLSGQQQA